MRAGAEILQALDKASMGLQAASTELSELSQHFHEARIDDNGEIVNGVGLEYDVAIKEEIAALYEAALEADKRPPPADVRAAKAERAVRVKRPDLWAEYHATNARIEALKSWTINQKQVISANQSIRRAEAS